MRRLEHCNIVKLMYFFYTSGEKKDEIYLNLVLEFIPETVRFPIYCITFFVIMYVENFWPSCTQIFMFMSF